MKLGKLLEKLGLWSDGIDDEAPKKPPAPAEEKKFEKRSVSLDTLRQQRAEADRQVESGKTAAGLGLEATPDQIYTAAGVKDPGHGWTLARLARELKPDDNLALILAEHEIPAESLIEDGLARDNALDRYEEHLDARVASYLDDAAFKLSELEEQARVINEKIAHLQRERADVEKRLDGWRAAKHAAEDELERVAGLVAPLVNREAPKFSAGRKPVRESAAPWAAPGHADTSPRDLPPPHTGGWAPPIVPENPGS